MFQQLRSRLSNRPTWKLLVTAFLVVLFSATTYSVVDGRIFGQVQVGTFDSQSTEADGALDFSGLPAGTTIEFDPDDTALFNPTLDQDGDGIYHFTTINIPSGVTVHLTSRHTPQPLFWLATGEVIIDGIIDLSGEDGQWKASNLLTDLIPHAMPGPGGYAGGLHSTSQSRATNGRGPGGGLAAFHPRDCCGRGTSAVFTGTSAMLVPLVGGSGGGGGSNGSGGAGGGALMIASSESIVFNGAILAKGGGGPPVGSDGWGGAGSGGAVRLAAPVMTGTGGIDVRPGFRGNGGGQLRLEAWNDVPFAPGSGSRSIPVDVFLPAGDQNKAASVRIVSIGGVSVPNNPQGDFVTPDITMDELSTVPTEVIFEAQNIPPNTRVKLHLFSKEGQEKIVVSDPLQGTFAISSARVSVNFFAGFAKAFVSWEP